MSAAEPGPLRMTWKVLGVPDDDGDSPDWVELTPQDEPVLEVRVHDWLDEAEVYLDAEGIRRLIEHLGSALAALEEPRGG